MPNLKNYPAGFYPSCFYSILPNKKIDKGCRLVFEKDFE